MNDTLTTIRNRRSIRSYKKDQIKDEELNQILEAAVYAPSGMNKQAWKFTALQNPELLKKLSALMKTALDMPKEKEYNFYKAPTLIIVSYDKNGTTGRSDCAAALENIFLSAASLGIGSCWINQLNHCCDDNEIRALLTDIKVPENYTVWGCAAIGYPEQIPAAPERLKGTIDIIK